MVTYAGRACPRCGGAVEMIHRSMWQRAASAVVPLRRLRCMDSGCAWEGVRRAGRQAARGAAPRMFWMVAAVMGLLLAASVLYTVARDSSPTSEHVELASTP